MAALADVVRESSPSSGGPEFDVLTACCGPSRKAPHLSALPGSNFDWQLLFDLAQHHRMFPALLPALANRPEVPESIQSTLRARTQRQAIQALRFSAELRRILEELARQRIEVLVHKGPVLAQYVFGDPAMRQYGDLDFLIRPADIANARVALAELGYTPKLRLPPRQEKSYLNSGYEHVFGSAENPSLIELQWRIVPRFYSIDFDMDALFSRSMQISFEGAAVHMLGKEDLMLALCVHAAKHEWNQLGMIRDIAALSGFDLDWDWIEREARRLGALRILMISLLLACDLFGVQFPLAVRKPGRSEWLISQTLAHRFQQQLRTGSEENPASVRYFWSMIGLRERWFDRARFAWRLATTPNVSEWKSVAIPDWLFVLYRAVRAGRLARRVMGSVSS